MCNVIAIFRVATLTLQTPKHWLVGVAIDRDARHACLRFFLFYVSCFFVFACFLFFFCQHKKKGYLRRRLKKLFKRNVARNREAIEAKKFWKKKKTKPWTLEVALRPSGVLFVL